MQVLYIYTELQAYIRSLLVLLTQVICCIIIYTSVQDLLKAQLNLNPSDNNYDDATCIIIIVHVLAVQNKTSI